MAFDISNKPYSDAAIIRSVYDLTDNALNVKVTGGGGSGSVPVTQVQMLDSGNQTVFLRNYIYDSAGAFDSFVDTDLDGVAYVLVGNAVPLDESQLAELQDLVISGPVYRLFYDYAVNVTTVAYTQIIASTSADVKQLEIFDSSGQLLVVAFGAAMSEVDQFYILPGGNGTIRCDIPAGTRISIKAVSANATSGYLAINASI